MGFRADGESILLLGDTLEELSGSEWAWVMHGHLGGMPPRVDLDRERLLGEILVAGSRDGLLSSAHDLSEGGLAQALVESALRYDTGARIVLPEEFLEGTNPFVFLFSESAHRAIVTVPRSEELRFTEMCTARRLPWQRIGVVDAEGKALEVQDAFTVPLTELREAHEGTLPKLFG
jgi:phosphoribosylformylglycinamidine synthase